jgi:nicotinate-nucleotide pyrophosphorylase (carboxylating)
MTDLQLDPSVVDVVVRTALAEDLRYGPDLTTSATVPADAVAVAAFVPREPGVLAGGPVALAALRAVVGAQLIVLTVVPDGVTLVPGESVLTVRGPVRGLLTAERTALNLLSQLSGVATLTRAWVDAVAGTGAQIRDTRKTVPGLRLLQKYAVHCGGGVNHRLGLGDACLIKDNHVVAAGSVTAAVRAVAASDPGVPLEVEVDTLEQLDEALECGVELILLDNFGLAATVEAVRRARSVEQRTGRRVWLESSGGLTVDRASAVAAAGVDYLAVGALTHSAPIVDLGMDLTAVGS